ncbi:MAG TPA: alpha-L-fucosidase [Dehalococcoidia bacterium]|nr:alpha-L-fucosidase [Dehalococcoidia bacterium]
MTTWFDTARFGMFVHWGHSSQRGIELSWPLVGGVAALPAAQNIPVDAYHATAATFDPKRYDPRSWAKMAKRLGMQYAVFTAKHHDGYAMYDTQLSDYSVMHSPVQRDLLRDFADAMRVEGIRVGVYFSLIDWHHPDYPAFTEADKPYVLGKSRQPTEEQWARFSDFMFGQVRELLTGYGAIAVIWFDGGWERTIPQWRSHDLEKMIRELQPGILINDRLPGVGDYVTPEQFVPPQPLPRPWETCMTINESWAYNPSDTRYKSARRIIHTLCEVAGRGGNLLLNVGPMGDGALPRELTDRLAVVEQWMSRNGEGIAGTMPALEVWQFYGPATRQGDTLYLHLLMRPYDTVTVRGVRIKKVRSARALGTGAELRVHTRTSIIDTLYNPDPRGELTIDVPEAAIDPDATVIAVEFEPGSGF